jgi:hypothetical protein
MALDGTPRTVLLHIDDHQCGGEWGHGGIVRPVVRNRGDLTLLDFVMRHMARTIHDRAVIMGRIENGEGPDARSASCHQHERTVHQPGGSLALSRLLRESIAWSILAAPIASKPDLGGAPRFLFGGRAGRLDDDIIAVGFAVRLHRRQEGSSGVQISTDQHAAVVFSSPPGATVVQAGSRLELGRHLLVGKRPFGGWDQLHRHVRNILEVAWRVEIQIGGVSHCGGV